MPDQQPIVPDDEHRVIQFRPQFSQRTAGRSSSGVQVSHPVVALRPRAVQREVQAPQQLVTRVSAQHLTMQNPAMPNPATQTLATLHVGGGVPELQSPEPQERPSAVDYRQRMIVNLAALVFVLFLTGAGVWVATTIKDLRRTQSCLLMGRRDCVSTPITPLAPVGHGWQLGEHI